MCIVQRCDTWPTFVKVQPHEERGSLRNYTHTHTFSNWHDARSLKILYLPLTSIYEPETLSDAHVAMKTIASPIIIKKKIIIIRNWQWVFARSETTRMFGITALMALIPDSVLYARQINVCLYLHRHLGKQSQRRLVDRVGACPLRDFSAD